MGNRSTREQGYSPFRETFFAFTVTMGSESRGLAVVVGGNRGIGLGLCKVLQAHGYQVLATCRKTTPELDALSGVKVVPGVDVAKPDGLEALFSAVQGAEKVKLLVVCAGYQNTDSLQNLDFAELDKSWQINTLGPLRVVKAMLPTLEAGASKVVLISSKMGSQGSKDIPPGGGLYGYRMSKTALNMAGKLLAEDLTEQQIPVGIIHPGAVDTDMLRALRRSRGVTDEAELSKGAISVEQSTSSIGDYITTQLDMSTTGQYWAADKHEVLPW